MKKGLCGRSPAAHLFWSNRYCYHWNSRLRKKTQPAKRPAHSRAERQENMRERKYVQERALRKLTRYLQLWLLPSHGISSISGQMQGLECCFSNEIIYLWKPTPAPGPKPIYQVWAAGGSGPGAINLPPVSPPVLHHAPLPLVPLLGLVRPPLAPPMCPRPSPSWQ